MLGSMTIVLDRIHERGEELGNNQSICHFDTDIPHRRLGMRF